ncbi:hypothetical protein [Leptotrichia massiliensis]|uniref:hypothetical protein n=1 Tax=Leptotrichia massiliensis TaxID=1852388 RepID=UPI0028D78C97|nr:hypothetical protein [Leptotrichia massiliensis]
MKTVRNAKVIFSKMGNGKGVRINLSVPLLKSLGIDEDNRDVLVEYDDETKTVIIKKS